MTSQGFELAVEAPEEDIERAQRISAQVPGAGSFSLEPSQELQGVDLPSTAWAVSAMQGGQPGQGDVTFDIELEGAQFSVIQPVPTEQIDIPRNISVTREGDDVTVSWDEVDGAQAYAAHVAESENGSPTNDTSAGCDATAGSETSCTIASASLTQDQEHVVALHAFSPNLDAEGLGRSMSFSRNQSTPFTW